VSAGDKASVIQPARAAGGHDAKDPVVLLEDRHVLGTAQPSGVLGDGVQDRLDVGRRAGDDAQDLAGGRLSFQGLGEFPVAVLQRLEQSDVRERDDRLVGEGLEEGDLSLREEPRLGAADLDRANRHSFSHQGDAEDRAEAHAPRVLPALREFVRFALGVCQVDGPPIHHRSARDRPADERKGELPDGADEDRAVMGDEEEPVAVPAPDGGVERLAQARGALRHGVEHRLDVRRRARDDAKNLARRRLLLQRLGRTLLELATPGGLVGQRIAAASRPGAHLGLRGLRTPTHRRRVSPGPRPPRGPSGPWRRPGSTGRSWS
jgi:hypothetical protein